MTMPISLVLGEYPVRMRGVCSLSLSKLALDIVVCCLKCILIKSSLTFRYYKSTSRSSNALMFYDIVVKLPVYCTENIVAC